MGDQGKVGLTRLELQVMQVVWRLGASGVSAVQDGLEQPLAYTTVQTMLNILTRKGKLKRKLRGRAYVYDASVTEAKASGNALKDLVERMFGGSAEELVMSLVKSRQLDAGKLAELSRRLDEVEGAENPASQKREVGHPDSGLGQKRGRKA